MPQDIKTVEVKVTAKTLVGSHTEKDKDSKEYKVNDYSTAVVKVPFPAALEDDIAYFGLEKYAHYARERICIRVADKARETLHGEGKDTRTQEQKNAAAQAAVAGFPGWLPMGRQPSVKASVKRAREIRATTLAITEAITEKPYDKWPKAAQAAFDARCPIV